MITFLRIRIKGFCSYEGDTTIELNQKQPVLIKSPNGSGKSTIFAALVWALYGKTPKEVSDVNTWKNLRSKNYKGTLVEVFFQKGSKVFKVIRCQNYTDVLDDGVKGKDRLVIYEDAETLNIKGKVSLQNFLEQELGMSFRVFINSIMFGQGLRRLINESNSDKKKIFEEVFNLGFLNIAKNLVSKEKSDLQAKFKESKLELDHINSEYVSTKEAFKDLKEKESSFKDSLIKKKRKLKLKRTELTKKLIEAKKEYSEEKVQLVEVKLQRLRKQLEVVKVKLADARMISNMPLLEVINKVIKLLEKGKVLKAIKVMKDIRKAFRDIEKLTNEKEEIVEKIYSLEDKSRLLKKSLRYCDELSRDIVCVDNEIKDLKHEKLKIISPKYKKKYLKLKQEARELEAVLSSKKAYLDNLDWLLTDPLSNKGIKAFLFDSSLEALNKTLEGYSEILGFRISFEVDLESTKKDFVTLIERDGQIIDYRELSGGEKQLCDVAMAFAMNESLTSSKGLNITFLDEVFESLDSENIDLVLSLINSIYEDKSLFLITHQESLPLSNVKTLQVIKDKGISSVKVL